jgi:hypothetical protein
VEGNRVNDGGGYVLKCGQGNGINGSLREFGVSSLKQFGPHLLGLVPHIIGHLIALQIN